MSKITQETLTILLAERVLGWCGAPGRFLLGNRRWIPRWRFQPAVRIEDAFKLLEAAAPQAFSICGDHKGNIRVRIRIGGSTGAADGTSKPLAITHAIARAIGIEVDKSAS